MCIYLCMKTIYEYIYIHIYIYPCHVNLMLSLAAMSGEERSMIVGVIFSDHLRKKIHGAIAHCEKHKIFKKCLYEGVRKYLVQTSDRVECLCCTSSRSHWVFLAEAMPGSYLRQGSEKLRELECMMEDAGYWSCLWYAYRFMWNVSHSCVDIFWQALLRRISISAWGSGT